MKSLNVQSRAAFELRSPSERRGQPEKEHSPSAGSRNTSKQDDSRRPQSLFPDILPAPVIGERPETWNDAQVRSNTIKAINESIPWKTLPCGLDASQREAPPAGGRTCLSIGAYWEKNDTHHLSELSIFSSDVVIKRRLKYRENINHVCSTRGTVQEFTTKSAREFCRQIRNQPLLNQVGVSGMATSTYGKNVPKDSKTVRRHIERMRKRLHYKGIGGYFMIEFQEARRAVHVHWILSKAVDSVSWGKMWCKCSDQEEDANALKVACHAKSSQVMNKPAGASVYAAKYASKAGLQKIVPDDFQWQGRWWGHWGLPVVTALEVYRAEIPQHASLRRLLRRKQRSEQSANYRMKIIEKARTIIARDLGLSFITNLRGISRHGRYLDPYQSAYESLVSDRRIRASGHLSPFVYRTLWGASFRKGKDWNKLTLYGQSDFVRSNWERIHACC